MPVFGDKKQFIEFIIEHINKENWNSKEFFNGKITDDEIKILKTPSLFFSLHIHWERLAPSLICYLLAESRSIQINKLLDKIKAARAADGGKIDDSGCYAIILYAAAISGNIEPLKRDELRPILRSLFSTSMGFFLGISPRAVDFIWTQDYVIEDKWSIYRSLSHYFLKDLFQQNKLPLARLIFKIFSKEEIFRSEFEFVELFEISAKNGHMDTMEFVWSMARPKDKEKILHENRVQSLGCTYVEFDWDAKPAKEKAKCIVLCLQIATAFREFSENIKDDTSVFLKETWPSIHRMLANANNVDSEQFRKNLKQIILDSGERHFCDHKCLRILADVLMVIIFPVGVIVAGARYSSGYHPFLYFGGSARDMDKLEDKLDINVPLVYPNQS